MFSLFIIQIFIGFYFWYATSKKMILPVIFGIEKKAQEKQTLFKLLGSFLMASGGFLAINYFGFGAGLIYLSIVLMTIASLIILLIPLGVLNKTTFLITSIISVLIENLI